MTFGTTCISQQFTCFQYWLNDRKLWKLYFLWFCQVIKNSEILNLRTETPRHKSWFIKYRIPFSLQYILSFFYHENLTKSCH